MALRFSGITALLFGGSTLFASTFSGAELFPGPEAIVDEARGHVTENGQRSPARPSDPGVKGAETGTGAPGTEGSSENLSQPDPPREGETPEHLPPSKRD